MHAPRNDPMTEERRNVLDVVGFFNEDEQVSTSNKSRKCSVVPNSNHGTRTKIIKKIILV